MARPQNMMHAEFLWSSSFAKHAIQHLKSLRETCTHTQNFICTKGHQKHRTPCTNLTKSKRMETTRTCTHTNTVHEWASKEQDIHFYRVHKKKNPETSKQKNLPVANKKADRNGCQGQKLRNHHLQTEHITIYRDQSNTNSRGKHLRRDHTETTRTCTHIHEKYRTYTSTE